MPEDLLPQSAYAALEGLQAQAIAVTATIPGNASKAPATGHTTIAAAQAQMAKHPEWVAKITKALMKDKSGVTVLSADAKWLARTFTERAPHWPAGATMTAQCPNCQGRMKIDIAAVREWEMPWRPVGCDTCLTDFELHADGHTVLMSAPPAQSTAKGQQLLNRTIHFDPDGGKNFPNTTAVEILLGGVGRLMFPDGTEQFVDDGVEPALIYSPRLKPDELERFCGQNLDRYERFHQEHEEQLVNYESVAMEAFW